MAHARHIALTRCRQSSLSFALMLLLICMVSPASAAKSPQTVKVEAAYVELHSGPGRGYPVFHTVERGDSVALIKRRTDWFKVRTEDGVEGWVDRRAIEQGAMPGTPVRGARDAAFEDYLESNFEAGFSTGDFDGDQVFSFRAGYRFNEYFMAELALSEVSGTFSSSTLYDANLLVQPFTVWRLTPFFTLGMGRFKNDPKDVLLDDNTTDDWSANAGLGLRAYLARRFILRADYRHYVVMIDDDTNEDFDAYTIGFSVFF
ncbi:MAG: outer membrane beta-barrel protein [Gammaproteobacteria bacterium]